MRSRGGRDAARAHARLAPRPSLPRYRSAKQTSRRDAKSILRVRISGASAA